VKSKEKEGGRRKEKERRGEGKKEEKRKKGKRKGPANLTPSSSTL